MNASDTVDGAIPGEPARWSIAGIFLESLTARDYDRLATTLPRGVRFGALRRGGPSEWDGRAEATGVFHSWFGEADRFEVVEATVGEIAGRLQMTWRIRLRPAPFDIGDGWHLIEQHAFADVAETIETLDLVCSGFRAERTSEWTTRMEETTMNPNQALWEKGDFTRIAASMRRSGEALVDQLEITEGLEVLDLGCGDGTTAVPVARRGAGVLGVDIARNLVDAGNKRAADEGLDNLRFQQGDACELTDLADDRFDLLVSIFGAMFAPRPINVAKEMVRVTRPGGRIVMGNWIPGDPTLVAQILKISSAYSPPPPDGFVSPMTWGVVDNVVERFTAAGISDHDIACEPDTFVFEAPVSPTEYLTWFRDYYGPTMNAFEAAASSGHADDLFAELDTLFTAQNTSSDPNKTAIPATFLRVTVHA